MRSHCAIYVDVGYLVASLATRVTGTSLRSAVVVSYPDLVPGLIAQAERLSGLPVLRIHWYDAGLRGSGGPSPEQNAIGMLPRVKLRLGRTSPNGDQKGVDLRIGLDLASHSRGRVVDVAYLVSGDDDLTEAVEEAQSHGVQVVVLAVPDANGRPHGVSHHLIRESDGIDIVDAALLDATVHVRRRAEEPAEAPGMPGGSGDQVSAPVADGDADPAPSRPTPAPAPPGSPVPSPADLARPRPRTPVVPAASAAPERPPVVYSSSSNGSSGYLLGPPAHDPEVVESVCRKVVGTWAATASADDRRRLLDGRPFIPPDLDRTLLTDLSARIGEYDVPDEARSALREGFWVVVTEVLA